MGYAPYFNDRLLGQFREVEFENVFEYRDRNEKLFPADFEPTLPHVVFVGNGQMRLAHVKKTVAYVLCGGDGPQNDLQKWQIKSHRTY